MKRNNSLLILIVAAVAIAGTAIAIYIASPSQAPIANNLPVNNANQVVNENANINRPTTPGGTALNPASQIIVSSPQPDQIISSPLTITGQARGTWYFEATFPVKLVDANGTVLAQGQAHANGDWMTTEFVPFSASLTFDKPSTDTGTLILERDNPSGLPQNANQLTVPVRFSATAPTAKNGCIVSGCNNEICAKEAMVSACLYKPEYACYLSATCEKQASGECGWTQTAELASCLSSNQK